MFPRTQIKPKKVLWFHNPQNFQMALAKVLVNLAI